jgi:hypothetical protein
MMTWRVIWRRSMDKKIERLKRPKLPRVYPPPGQRGRTLAILQEKA